MNEQLDMRGRLTLQLIDSTGKIIHEQRPKNRIVKSGRNLVAELFARINKGEAPEPVSYMAVGTNNTRPADDQKELLKLRAKKEITSRDIREFTEKQGDQEVKRIQVLLSTEFESNEATGEAPLQEAAIFNGADVMYNRVTFDPVLKREGTDFRLSLIWEIIF